MENTLNIERLLIEDLAIREVPATIGGKEYIIREASGEAVAKWQTAQTKGMKLDKTGRPIELGDGAARAELELVAQCLWEKYEDSKGTQQERLVPMVVLKDWGNRHIRKIFKIAQEISELEIDTLERLEEQIKELQERRDRVLAQQDVLKNGRNGTTVGSSSVVN